MGTSRHRHLSHLLRRGAEPMHVPLQDHGVGDGGAEHAEGHGEGHVRLEQAGGAPDVGDTWRPDVRRQVARALAEAPELALAKGPVHDDGLGGPALHRHRRVGHRRAGAAATGQPRQAGVAQLGQPQIGGHEGGLVAVLGERRQAVDVVGCHPGVGDGGQHGLDGQLVLARVGDAAPLRVPGLAHAHETGVASR